MAEFLLSEGLPCGITPPAGGVRSAALCKNAENALHSFNVTLCLRTSLKIDYTEVTGGAS